MNSDQSMFNGKEERQPAPSGADESAMNFDADASVTEPVSPAPVSFIPAVIEKTGLWLVFLLSYSVKVMFGKNFSQKGNILNEPFGLLLVDLVQNTVEKVFIRIKKHINETYIDVHDTYIDIENRILKVMREIEGLKENLLDFYINDAGRAAAERFIFTLRKYGEDELPAGFADKAREVVECFSENIKVEIIEARKVIWYPDVSSFPELEEWMREDCAVFEAAASAHAEFTKRCDEGFQENLENFFKAINYKGLNRKIQNDIVSGSMKCLSGNPLSGDALIRVVESCINEENAEVSTNTVDYSLLRLNREAFNGRCDGVFNNVIALGAMIFSGEKKICGDAPEKETGCDVEEFLKGKVATTAYVDEYLMAENPTGEELLDYLSNGFFKFFGVGVFGINLVNARKSLEKFGALNEPVINRMGLSRLDKLGYKEEEISPELISRLKDERSGDCKFGLVKYIDTKTDALRGKFSRKPHSDRD